MSIARLLLALTVALLAGLLAGTVARAQDVEERADLQALFTEAGTAGTMAVRDYGRNRVVVVNPARAEQPFSPSSTFKIPNTLIALRTGVVSGLDETFSPPAQPFLAKGKPFLPEACGKAVTLRTALQNSCIPVFQEIAGRVGSARFNELLQRTLYAPPVVTDANLRDFWLDGTIKLSARDQVAFLDRLLAGRLPFMESHIAAVADALETDRSAKGVLYGKTGYVFTSEPALGWYMGWIRRDGDLVAAFALNLDLARPEHASARRTIALDVLKRLELW